MNIITKQLILNEIQLPTDVINIIKEFCFVNIEEVAKQNKLKINRIIRSADLYTYSESDDGCWHFEIHENENEYGEKFKLKGFHCSNCGNYRGYFCKSWDNYIYNWTTCTCWEKNKIVDYFWKYPLSVWI
jgi:hypothetical protein